MLPREVVAQGGCVVRTRKLEEDQVLQQLWDSAAGWPAGRVQKMLCDNEYHCSCKEIQNCRLRLKERQRCLKPRRLELENE